MSMIISPTFFSSSQQADDTSDGIPNLCNLSCVLDVFHHAPNEVSRAELVVIAGCALGGSHVVRSGETLELPELLQQHVNVARVSNRDGMREIVAQVIDVFTVDSVELRQAAGYNDGVLLFGHWCARLQSGTDVLLHRRGCLTVGRLNLLYAFHTGLNYTWAHPESSEDTVYHLLLPTEPYNETARGEAIGLVYPAFDVDTFNRADNTAMTFRLIYDLLVQLQEELRRDGVKDKFVRAVLPVPSRRRLEIELEGSGYAIRGDKAIKLKQQASDPKEIGEGLGARFRRWTAHWNAERIDLPPQATAEDYRVLIEQAINLAASEGDKETMHAVRDRMRVGIDRSTVKPRRIRKSKA